LAPDTYPMHQVRSAPRRERQAPGEETLLGEATLEPVAQASFACTLEVFKV